MHMYADVHTNTHTRMHKQLSRNNNFQGTCHVLVCGQHATGLKIWQVSCVNVPYFVGLVGLAGLVIY